MSECNVAVRYFGGFTRVVARVPEQMDYLAKPGDLSPMDYVRELEKAARHFEVDFNVVVTSSDSKEHFMKWFRDSRNQFHHASDSARLSSDKAGAQQKNQNGEYICALILLEDFLANRA